ncbi:hypothetical protein ATANTOWER_009578 [Ataeniobius toweri]|uniref:Secreted protein n=1 Tax=Ataeniobius toweri TaxID=208326 RepID=A0ABU7AE70_9TELE|nr:hypothetical protein [Ataeniobius toweri]
MLQKFKNNRDFFVSFVTAVLLLCCLKAGDGAYSIFTVIKLFFHVILWSNGEKADTNSLNKNLQANAAWQENNENRHRLVIVILAEISVRPTDWTWQVQPGCRTHRDTWGWRVGRNPA